MHYNLAMIRHALVLLAAIATAGCLRSTTTIELRADGSGTVLQETAVTAQALAMLKGFASSQGDAAKAQSEIFSEEQARQAAATMGVTFVSGEPIKTAELEGYRARYRFDDISKVKVNMDPGVAGMSGDARRPPFGFSFAKTPASSILTIDMPEQAPGKGAMPGLPPMGGSDADKAQAAQALVMMKMMMKGLFVDVALNVDGRIIKSNAPAVEGSRVTLLQIDFDKLLADEAALQKLTSTSDLKALASVPGLKVATEPTVTIEFAR
jgi:hypothetical protein